MDPIAFGLVLGSAFLHASWNLVVKGSSDRLVAGTGQLVLGSLVFLPFLVASGVPTAALTSILVSSVVHVLYGLTLIGAYDRADLSLVYPVARGSAPVLVTIGAAALLNDTPGWLGLVAILFVVAGVLLTAAGGDRRGLNWALATGLLIATYTLVDGAAVRSLEGSFSYTLSVFAGSGIGFTVVLLLRRTPRQIADAVRGEKLRLLLAGAASAGAYILVLIAARRASLGLVAAVRETAVVFGAFGGWLFLRENFERRRLIGVALIVVGLVILGVTR